MNQNESYQVASDALAEESEIHGITAQRRSEPVQLDDAASNAIVQCLLIAARRGRQIRLARERAAQQQQNEPGSVSEEASSSNEM